ncbi:annulin [Patella vulgata]|uniref:annulin n=1 Tax=Patella vulgata TaxID=6465 RepID=UPI00217F9F15|nr:annulin [Patella vulgata]XP_050397107.1 annulin [Patella vulgata]
MGQRRSKPIVGDTITREVYHRNHVGLAPARRANYIATYGTRVLEPTTRNKEALRVESVTFNIKENTPNHHTSEFDITQPDQGRTPQLVVRRGQPFDITLTFNRPYDKNEDDLRLVFQAGKEPLPSKQTHIEFVLSDVDLPKQWGAKVAEQDRNTLRVTIFTPPNCYVAKWAFKIDVVKKADQSTAIYRYTHKEPIYILFNPWCKDDQVYNEDSEALKEYVLNETGRIYAGTHNNIAPKPWNFGQFEDHVLECSLLLLDIAGLNWTVRGNAVSIIRKLTALVNAPDDGGVLVGNWSGDYKGGKPPLSWTGSAPILEEFYRTKMPVKFGQCWVFSGVLTTICRALGIPARSVTNFSSAHDTDGSVSIDIYFNSDGFIEEKRNVDSVWNFHVWNEVWMSRPDLPAGYGGWQAADATPQETSDGVYCCGPASMTAIKDGELGLPYDGPFIFAEVNADKVYWVTKPDGSMATYHVEQKSIGLNISTKLPLRDEREDITTEYKYPEGTQEERTAVLRANQTGSSRHDIYVIGASDMEFELVEQDDVFVGESFDVILKITNTGTEERYIHGRLGARTMYYTGVSADKVRTDTFQMFVQGGRATEQRMKVNYKDYSSKLKDMCMLKLTAMAKVQDTEQIFTTQGDFRLCKPDLTLKIPDELKVKKSYDVEVSFTNPLADTLTNCYLEVEGPHLLKRHKYPQRSVKPKQTFVTKFEMTPSTLGERELVVIFNSDQLLDINTTQVVNVVN